MLLLFGHCMGAEAGACVTEARRTLWLYQQPQEVAEQEKHIGLRAFPCPGHVGAVAIYFVTDLRNKPFYKDKVHVL